MAERRKQERRKELPPPIVEDLHETFFDGIRKTLYWIRGTGTPDKDGLLVGGEYYVKVVDEKRGGMFLKEGLPLPEDPLHFLGHIMIHAPERMERGRPGYSHPSSDKPFGDVPEWEP